MELFKKIFDLDPKEVEEFVKSRVLETVTDKDYFNKYYEMDVRWYPTVSEFYVHFEPRMETEDYKHYTFEGKKVKSVRKYFQISFGHQHFTFQEIYGLMTGETVLYGHLAYDEPNRRGYMFVYNKEYVNVVVLSDKKKAYVSDWDEEKDCEIEKPIPADLMEHIKKEKIFEF